MPNATPGGTGAGLPVAAAAAVPPAGLVAADQAFDDVFRQLTGGLLTTSAQAGEALAEFDAAVEGEGGDGDTAEVALPFGIVPVPVLFTLPAVTTPVVTEGEGGETPADDAAGIATATVATGASTAAAAGAATRAAGAVPVAGADTPAAAPFELETAPAEGAAKTAAAEDADVLAALTLPADAAGTATPSTEVEAHVRGLDRRRGMRETPARARTFDTDTAETNAGASAPEAPAPGGAPAPGPAPAPAAAAAENSGTASRELPATAERAFALQRALARQHDNTHRDAAAPGLVTQVAATGGAASGGGAEPPGDDPSHGRKPGRAWSSGGVPGVTLPAPVAPAVPTAAAGHVTQAPSDAATPGPAATAAWRAAIASSALPDLAGAAADAARSAAAPGLVAGLPPAVELAAIRDRGPSVVETPHAMPELDAATGEAVHTQIVKSIRMQWTGGVGEARVTLKPGYLGEVTASIKVEQGVVTATLQADTPEVRRWMESHTATLRDALVDHGLRLDRLTVGEPERQATPGDRQAKSRQQPRQQAPRQRARRETPGTDTPFEVTPD